MVATPPSLDPNPHFDKRLKTFDPSSTSLIELDMIDAASEQLITYDGSSLPPTQPTHALPSPKSPSYRDRLTANAFPVKLVSKIDYSVDDDSTWVDIDSAFASQFQDDPIVEHSP